MINKNNLVYKKKYLREHQIKTIFTILKLIQNKKNLNILDVGCANGNLVSFLKKNLKYQNNFEGVEIDRSIIKNDKKIFDNIYFSDFEKFLKKNKKKYDFLILSGIICFFKNPFEKIISSLQHLKKNGQLIIFDRFTEYADVNIEHKFKSEKKMYSTYNATSIYKLKQLKKKNNIKSIKYSKFKLKKNIKKNTRNLWQSYTVGTGEKKIILSNLDMVNNFYHVLIKKC
jgi:2-polyprenyl-3-methyl-5-hydroxy-6-metoxy-1,4-benzoquinol methylase